MQALKALVIFMGVLLVAGTGLLVVTVIRRVSDRAVHPPIAASLPGRASVALPQDARIEEMIALGSRLALRVSGPAGDTVLLIDPATGAIDETIDFHRIGEPDRP
jgi:hypothetical protein